MSASPQPRPKEPTQKPPKLDRHGRDPLSPSEKLRTSDFDKQTGYAPLFFSIGADLSRLTSGNACTLLIIHATFRSTGRHPGKEEKRQEWTTPTSVKDWAQLCSCDERTIERELKGLENRKLAEVKRESRGQVSIRLLYRDWQKLPDYKPNVVDISTGEDFQGEEGEQEAKVGSRVELTKKPQPARAGKSSRKIPVTCGVKNLRLENNSVVDLSFTAVVQAGELILYSQVPEAWLKQAAKKIAVLNGTNNLASAQRHGCRDTFASSSPVSDAVPTPQISRQSPDSRRSKGEHPREKELCKLFDPLLLKSGSRILSADPVALSEACQAVGATDHDFLVKFVVGRADRAIIKSPKHCKDIAHDAARNWEKVKDLPPGQRGDAQESRKPPLSAYGQSVADELDKKYGKRRQGRG